MGKNAYVAVFTAVLPMGLLSVTPTTQAQEEFDVAKVIVEINATDGDVGFHALVDGETWQEARIYSPDGNKLFKAEVKDRLQEQGLTENFFESAEPLCAPDSEEEDAEVVPLSEFLQRFPAGEYRFTGKTIENEALESTAELTHNLPAAPAEIEFDGVTVTWMPGEDLGECQDDTLVEEGTIPDPATVEVVGWEVAIEPVDDEAVDPLRVFRTQLPPNGPVYMTTVPAEFMEAYAAQGVTEFKVEVGAIEASGNQTFAEEEFDLAEP